MIFAHIPNLSYRSAARDSIEPTSRVNRLFRACSIPYLFRRIYVDATRIEDEAAFRPILRASVQQVCITAGPSLSLSTLSSFLSSLGKARTFTLQGREQGHGDQAGHIAMFFDTLRLLPHRVSELTVILRHLGNVSVANELASTLETVDCLSSLTLSDGTSDEVSASLRTMRGRLHTLGIVHEKVEDSDWHEALTTAEQLHRLKIDSYCFESEDLSALPTTLERLDLHHCSTGLFLSLVRRLQDRQWLSNLCVVFVSDRATGNFFVRDATDADFTAQRIWWQLEDQGCYSDDGGMLFQRKDVTGIHIELSDAEW